MRGTKKRRFVKKRIRCLFCGRIEEIQRRKSKNRGAGHIKEYWCIDCQKRTSHEELPDFYEAVDDP